MPLPREKDVIHDGSTAKLNPTHGDVDTDFRRVFLYQLVILHQQKRQEAEAARSQWDAQFTHFCAGAGRPQDQRSRAVRRTGTLRSGQAVSSRVHEARMQRRGR